MRGGATGDESQTDSGAVAPDSGATTPDSGVPSPCAGQTALDPSLSVTGTIRGAGVNARLSETGLETTFVGPDGPGSSSYAQSFDRGYDAAGKLVR